MKPEEAIEILDRLHKVDPWKRKINQKAYDAISMAIEALQLQIPMKQMEESAIDGRRIKVCGNCGDSPGGGWEYCSWCGQKQEV